MANAYFFTKYSQKGASSRIRVYGYRDYFLKSGYRNVNIYSLFSDQYLENLYSNKKLKNIIVVIICYFRRFINLIRFKLISKPGDLLWVEYELFPYLPFFIESFFVNNSKVICVFDFDDPIYRQYDKFYFLKNKFKKLLSNSKIIFISSKSMKNDILNIINIEKIHNIYELPTPLDFEYQPKSILEYDKKAFRFLYNKPCNPIRIGWIGSPSTFKFLEKELIKMKDIINNKDYEIKIMGISDADKKKYESITNLSFFDWSESNQSIFLDNIDIGLMPLDKSIWSSHRDYFKIALYSSRGIPVIAHSNDANKALLNTDINIILASFGDFNKKIRSIAKDSFDEINIYKSRSYAFKTWSRKAVFEKVIDKLELGSK